MAFWNIFNKVGKELPNVKEVLKVPHEIKTTAVNVNLNKIAVRFFTENWTEAIETTGEIVRFTTISLVLFEIPNMRGAVVLLKDFTYINRSKNNELTIDVYENYPYGIDKKSELKFFDDVEYKNAVKERMLFVPVMNKKIPIPVIKLDNSERLTPIDKSHAKLLANISQTFLREYIDIKLLQRTGNKNSTGFIYVAILFFAIGTLFGVILSAFI